MQPQIEQSNTSLVMFVDTWVHVQTGKQVVKLLYQSDCTLTLQSCTDTNACGSFVDEGR